MNKKILVLVCMIILSLTIGVAGQVIEGSDSSRGPNWDKTCQGNKCTLTSYIGQVNIENENGDFVPFTEAVKWDWVGNEEGYFNLSYLGYSVAIQPFVVYDGNNYTIPEIKSYYPQVNFKKYIFKQEGSYKWGINFTNIPSAIINNIDYIGLKLISSNGLAWDDVDKTTTKLCIDESDCKDTVSIIVKNKLKLDFSDLILNNFTLTMPDKRIILIGNVQKTSIYLDPTIYSQVNESGNDGYVRGTAFIDTYTQVRIGHDGYGATSAWLYFPNVSIPQGSTITTAYYEYFVNSEDAFLTNIYLDKSAEPSAPVDVDDYNSKSLTTAFVPWDDDHDTNQWEQSPSIVSLVQEVVDSYTITGLQILHKDDGSADSQFLKAYSYDGSASLAAQLHIEYTEGGDSTPPTFTTSPYNKTTTNESVEISWTTDENANYTLTIGLCPGFTGVNSFSNATLATTHNKWINNLENSTNYCVNVTATDSSGNSASENVSFTTAANIAEEYANEQEGDNAIQSGIESSEIWTATVYDSYQVSGANLTNQFSGRFDKFAIKGNKRWAINYVSEGESSITGIFSITPTLYVLQLEELSSEAITDQVGDLINSTYP